MKQAVKEIKWEVQPVQVLVFSHPQGCSYLEDGQLGKVFFLSFPLPDGQGGNGYSETSF